MKYRKFSNTDWKFSEIGLGCWGLGGSWTDVTKKNALKIIEDAVNRGVNFLDTADTYGDGESEKIIGKFLQRNSNKIYLSTKIGGKLKPFLPENYNLKYLESYLDSSLKNLKTDCVDLLQLHCPPKQLIEKYEIHESMNVLIKKGKIKKYGISIFTIDEAEAAIKFDGVSSIQLVFNIFRQKPIKNILKEASRKKIAIIARGPFASGILTGSINKKTIFPPSDHRNFNLKGKYFTIAETFSGIPLTKSFLAINKLKEILPNNVSLIDLALAWILQHKEVTTVIPGATHPLQVELNYKNKKIKNIKKLNIEINKIYEKYIKIHDDRVS